MELLDLILNPDVIQTIASGVVGAIIALLALGGKQLDKIVSRTSTDLDNKILEAIKAALAEQTKPDA